MAQTLGAQQSPSRPLANYAIGATILGLLLAFLSGIALAVLLGSDGLRSTGGGRLSLFIIVITISSLGGVILSASALIFGVLSLRRGEPARAIAGIAIGFGITGAPLLLSLIGRFIG